MFTGLSAFPLTPLVDEQVDLAAYRRLIARLVDAGVDSIGALGSTGSYAYLDRDDRRAVIASTVEHANGIPVIAGIGATRTAHVQALADDAQRAGASAVMLAPVSYQPLTADEVFRLYEDVSAGLSVPLVVYDNPTTTGFTFTDELYARIAGLPQIAAIKIPPIGGLEASRERVRVLREALPANIRIGISGDGVAAAGLLGGCDAWFTAVGGTIPRAMLAIARPAAGGDESALTRSARLQPLWDLFAAHGGSARVTSAIAEHLGLVTAPSLPRPLLGLAAAAQEDVARVVDELQLFD